MAGKYGGDNIIVILLEMPRSWGAGYEQTVLFHVLESCFHVQFLCANRAIYDYN